MRPENRSGPEVSEEVSDVVEMCEDKDDPAPKRRARRPIADSQEGAGDTVGAL